MAWKPNDYGTLGLTYDHGALFVDCGKVRLGNKSSFDREIYIFITASIPPLVNSSSESYEFRMSVET